MIYHITLFAISFLLIYNSARSQELPQEVTELHQKAEALGKTQPDSAFYFLQKAEAASPKNQRMAVQTVNHWLRARTMYLQKEYDSTEYYAQKAIDLGKIVKDYGTLADVYNLLGVLAKRQGRFDESLEAYRKSMANTQMSGDSATWAKVLQNLGNVHRQLGQTDSALYYYEQSILIKKRLGDALSTAKTLLNLGNYYFSVGQFKEAVTYYERALPFYHEANYDEGIGRLENNLGAAYYELGYYTLSTRHFIKGLALYDSLQMKEPRANTLINIAAVLREQGSITESINYYQQALESFLQLGRPVSAANIYRNLGELQVMDGKWQASLNSLENAARTYSQQQMKKDLSEVYHGFGRAYGGLNNGAMAEKYFGMSLELKRETNDSLNMGRLMTSMGVFAYNAGELRKALAYYQQGLEMAENFELPILSRANLLGLSEVYEALNQPKNALAYRIRYEAVKDSLDNVEKDRQVAELKEQYESAQKDKRISDLAMENSLANAEIDRNTAIAEKQRAIKITFLVAAIALTILVVVLYFYFRQRLFVARLREEEEQAVHKRRIESLLDQQHTKNLEARIAGEEQERQRLAKDLHDHLGSILATVKVNLQGIFEREKRLKENEQVQTVNTLVNKACNDVRGIAHNLHMGISENFGLTTALKDLADSVSGTDIKVSFTAANCQERFVTNLEIFIYRMVQEFLSNALRHSEASQISIQLTCLEDLISIIVEDNGKGFNNESPAGNGIGLKNLMSRIEEFEGDITIDSTPGKGTTILVDLPLTYESELA